MNKKKRLSEIDNEIAKLRDEAYNLVYRGPTDYETIIHSVNLLRDGWNPTLNVEIIKNILKKYKKILHKKEK
jgi:hypothetical protein